MCSSWKMSVSVFSAPGTGAFRGDDVGYSVPVHVPAGGFHPSGEAREGVEIATPECIGCEREGGGYSAIFQALDTKHRIAPKVGNRGRGRSPRPKKPCPGHDRPRESGLWAKFTRLARLGGKLAIVTVHGV